jgi:neopullulanase
MPANCCKNNAHRLCAIWLSATCFLFCSTKLVRAQERVDANAPLVKKVEPPNWWVGLTENVMVLLHGKNLRATHAQCNLPEVIVDRTQSSSNGDYLFVWLKFLPQLRSGTAVCRIATPAGQTSFEFPLAARKQILGRNQGLSLDDVIYSIVPDRFADGDPTNDEAAEFSGSHDGPKPHAYHGGDLKGIEQHLAYLKDLGVTTLSLTPIVKTAVPADYDGSGAVDLYALDPHLGTIGDYQELVKQAHQQHMKVFFEIVPNHVGPLNPWVTDPPMADWFHGTTEQHLATGSTMKGDFYGAAPQGVDSFALLVDPHTPAQMREKITNGWLNGILPDLNTENPVVVDYLIQNSIWWAETSGLDGYRIAAFPYVPRALWQRWHEELRRIYPRLTTIGKVNDADPTVTSFFAGGRKGWDGIDTQLTTVFDYPMYLALRDVLLNGAPAGRIANILRQDSLYPHPEFLLPFFGNGEVPRFMGVRGASVDQLKLAFALTITLRGIPDLYYGDEIGMSGSGDLDGPLDFPGGWPGDPQNAFTRAGRSAEQEQIFETVQRLLQLRREHDSLRAGRLWHLASDDSSYVFMRESDEERLVVSFNTGTSAKTLEILLRGTPGAQATDVNALFGNGRADLQGGSLKLLLPAESLTIFELP